MHIKFAKVCSSEGSLGKNIGCEKAAVLILKGTSAENISAGGGLEALNKKLENSDSNFFVGGDHSITYPLFKRFAEKNKGKKLCLVVLDAHCDCANYINPPSHEDFLRVLIEDKIVNAEDVFLIGVRRIYEVEKKFLSGKRVNLHRWKDAQGNIRSCLELLRGKLQEYDKIYLSIDIDVLNPETAPGTGYLHKGGMSFSELKRVLEAIKGTRKLGRVDLVEVNPLKDVNFKTISIARKIIELFL